MSRRPYPKYKPSGIEWLGEVPEHWEVDRLKWTVRGCINGIWGSDPVDSDEDLICVRVADFDRTSFRVCIENPTLRAIPEKDRLNRILSKGNLLLEKSGGGELQPVGVVVMYDHSEPAVCSNFVGRMPVKEGFDPGFLTYLHASLYAGRVNARSIKQTTGIQNLDASAYLDERACYPPLPEQRAIAAFLDRETAQIDAMIEKVRQSIDLLREYRTALISAAVTGKIDVRKEVLQ